MYLKRMSHYQNQCSRGTSKDKQGRSNLEETFKVRKFNSFYNCDCDFDKNCSSNQHVKLGFESNVLINVFYLEDKDLYVRNNKKSKVENIKHKNNPNNDRKLTINNNQILNDLNFRNL